MRKIPETFISPNGLTYGINKNPKNMSKDELLLEISKRKEMEKKLKVENDLKTHLIEELELHQIELEIQNRQVLESFKELEALNAKYIDLYDFAPVGYLTVEKNGKILALNLVAATYLGKEKGKIQGRIFFEWLDNNYKLIFVNFLQTLEKSEKNLTLEIELKDQLSENPYFQIFGRKIVEENGKIAFRIAMIDQQEKKRAEAAEGKLLGLDQELSFQEKYMWALSHDLRTPLTSSKLCAQMLDSAICDIEKKKRLLQLMVQELERADSMVRELLNSRRARGLNKSPVHMKECDLKKLVEKHIENTLTLNDIQINFRSEGQLVGNWSKDGLQRIIDNLLSNAIKYGEKLKPITISLEDKGLSVRIVVHNLGTPIPLIEQKLIFEAFHRVSSNHSEILGWGLGLSLVKQIVDRHQGNIHVISNHNDGTSFVVEIPKFPSN